MFPWSWQKMFRAKQEGDGWYIPISTPQQTPLIPAPFPVLNELWTQTQIGISKSNLIHWIAIHHVPEDIFWPWWHAQAIDFFRYLNFDRTLHDMLTQNPWAFCQWHDALKPLHNTWLLKKVPAAAPLYDDMPLGEALRNRIGDARAQGQYKLWTETITTIALYYGFRAGFLTAPQSFAK